MRFEARHQIECRSPDRCDQTGQPLERTIDLEESIIERLPARIHEHFEHTEALFEAMENVSIQIAIQHAESRGWWRQPNVTVPVSSWTETFQLSGVTILSAGSTLTTRR